MNRQILRLAIPNIISNVTVPLLGLIDIAIAGHLSSTLYIGAIALGSTIFSMIYWNFSFLRMGTSGFTAQAYGARNFEEMMGNLARSMIIALSIGMLIIIMQIPIFAIASHFIATGAESTGFVGEYFFICVWSAPAMLGMYAYNGWLTGMQNARTPMIIAILNNVLNIILSLFFVFGLGMQIKGIALGTMLSQWISFIVMTLIVKKFYSRQIKYFKRDTIFRRDKFAAFFTVNRDIFLRTLMLVAVTTFFTFASSKMGNTLLAVNSLLMQFFLLFSYFMDGFAYAGEALTGRFIGAGNNMRLNRLIGWLFVWGVGLAALYSLIYALFMPQLLNILTDKQEIIAAAKDFSLWTILIPFASFASFVWDGIYIGAMASTQMRNSMMAAAAMFFATYYLASSHLGNNALWLAFILYLLSRGAMQTIIFFANRRYFSV
jgi:MATE family multidrug resistance protein